MRRNIFNRYKYKRKWKRGVKRASKFVLSTSRDEAKSKKDFAWHRAKVNPFWRKQDKIDWKRKTKIGIIAFSAVIILGFGLYHPFFHINSIKISGLQRISEQELTDAIYGAIDYKKLFLFPGQNYFLIDVKELENIIKKRFPIESIIIKKNFPNTISIQLEEKISTIIYDNGQEYSYLGLEGKIVEIIRKVGEDEWKDITQTVTSTDEQGKEIVEQKVIDKIHTPPVDNIISEIGDYPIVYDKRGKKGDINAKILEKETISGIIEWFNLINKRTNIPFGYVIIENELGEGIIKTKEGWKIIIKLTEDIDWQFAELQYLLKEKIQRPNLNYIDVRYKDRVYWQ